MTDSPIQSDFAAARLYLCGGSHNRMIESMREARKLLQNRFSKLKEFPNKPPEMYSEPSHGTLLDWCRLDKGPTIAWGIYFNREGSDYWAGLDPPVRFREGVFLEIEFKRVVQRPLRNGFGDWHFPVDRVLQRNEIFGVSKMAALSDFGEDFGPEFSTWVADSFAEGQALISAVEGSPRRQK